MSALSLSLRDLANSINDYFNRLTLIYFSISCSIQFDDYVIITGGSDIWWQITVQDTVSVYDDNGWVKDLAPLLVAVYGHACGYYYNGENNLVLFIKH